MAFEPEFKTEKQIEESLKREGRYIAMPDGSRRWVSGFKVMWDAYDFLISEYGRWTEKEIVEIALVSSKETGRSFEDAFVNMVGYIYHDIFH